ncbi:MAG: prepilin-type N-terminal cleavage/methylation domain-containing protein [Acidimicrobiales bacterium]|jgi:prepilin-type N-terminal cleavage/methylation domain-containing protein
MNNTKHTKGYSLVEVLVALSILLLALTGPMVIAMKGLQSSYYAREKVAATYLAQEGIEAFIAMRNDATLAAINANSLSTSWSWIQPGTRNSNLNSCFTATGCNTDYTDQNPINRLEACTASGSNCRLYYDEDNSRARYSLSSAGQNAVLSPFTRVITIMNDPSGRGIQITATVSWVSQLFAGQTQSIALTSSLFSVYE